MNNLLEQANIRMAEIEETTCDLENIDSIEQIKDELEVVLLSDRSGTRYLRGLSPEKLQELKDIVLKAVMDTKEEKTIELKRLLGIEKKPVVINPEFEKAVQENVKPPYKADHLTEINGIPKYIANAESDQVEVKHKYPEMTVGLVRELYHHDNMTLDEVAKEFGVNRTALYKFVTKNNLRKPNKREQKLFIDAQVEKLRDREPKSEKERP